MAKHPKSQNLSTSPSTGRPRRRWLWATYGVGIGASILVLMWEDVVASGGAQALVWGEWRWGISASLALGKSVIWPLYWLARAFGIEAGGA